MANMARNPITDYSPLYKLPNLKNACVGPFSDDKLQEIQQAMPGVSMSWFNQTGAQNVLFDNHT